MNNTRYTLTFYGGLWLALFVIYFLTPGFAWWTWIIAGLLLFLCPVWQHIFEWMLDKKLYREHMAKHNKEHAENLKADENRA